MDDTLKFIDEHKLIASIRASDPDDAQAIAKALAAGGFKMFEIPMTVPHAARTIETLAKKEELFVGAGTVADGEVAQRAINAGAKFVASQFTDKTVITVCKNNNTLVIQGAATPTEVMEATALFVDLINLYPIETIGGPSFLGRAKKFCPSSTRFLVSGGVTCDNILDYIREGATAVTLGRVLCDKSLIRAHHWDEITERAKKIYQKLESLTPKVVR